jgi:hypothetical protein
MVQRLVSTYSAIPIEIKNCRKDAVIPVIRSRPIGAFKTMLSTCRWRLTSCKQTNGITGLEALVSVTLVSAGQPFIWENILRVCSSGLASFGLPTLRITSRDIFEKLLFAKGHKASAAN